MSEATKEANVDPNEALEDPSDVDELLDDAYDHLDVGDSL